VKTRRLIPLLVLSTTVLTAATDDGITFSGVLVQPDRTIVHLEEEAKSLSLWIPVGGTFAGYVVSAYDAKAETVLLTNDHGTLRIHLLDDAKVKNGKPAPSSEKAEIPANARQIILTKDGITLNGKAVTEQELAESLAQAFNQDKDTPIALRPGPDTRVDQLARIMDVCRKIGFTKFSIESRN